jgi:D,D-heptose 1,7-bisphosphate phosphatase
LRQAVILAGGKGTRLLSRSGALPKALIDLGGTPLLGHQLRLLQEHGFTKVLLLVNYLAESISDYCRASAFRNLNISVLHDGQALGTAGAVLQALPQLDEQFAVLYGDTMLNVDLTRFWNWHARHPQAAASLFLHPNDHPQDSDLVELDNHDRILRFHPYPHPDGAYLPNLVNAALYIVRRDALSHASAHPQPFDFAKHLFPQMLQNGAQLLGYVSPEYIKDAGTPHRLDAVRRDLASGLIARSSLAVPQRAVFLDRDGTINEERGHIRRADALNIFEHAGPAIRRLHEAGWRTVLITNQPVLARGEATAEDLRQIHAKLDTVLARSGAFLDRKYICPHHPESGFPGEVPALKTTCACRKPSPGLIFQAQNELNLNLAESWFIGDSAADIGAARAAGVTSILVRTGLLQTLETKQVEPDFMEENLASAVDLILNHPSRCGPGVKV